MSISRAWEELGGGLHSLDEPENATPAPASAPQRHEHAFDELSGWCDCGERDTGEIYPFTPAARKAANTAQGARR